MLPNALSMQTIDVQDLARELAAAMPDLDPAQPRVESRSNPASPRAASR
jgi:hypothetical protein